MFFIQNFIKTICLNKIVTLVLFFKVFHFAQERKFSSVFDNPALSVYNYAQDSPCKVPVQKVAEEEFEEPVYEAVRYFYLFEDFVKFVKLTHLLYVHKSIKI